MSSGEMINSFRQTHETAVKAAAKKMPDMNATELVDLLVAVVSEEKTTQEAVKVLVDKYKVPAETYLNTFEKIGKQQAVDYLLKQSKAEGLQGLAGTDFSENLIKAAEKAGIIVQKYYEGSLSGEEFILKLWDCGIADVALQAVKASSLDVQNLAVSYSQLMNMPITAVTYAAATEAYSILMQAMDDATAQHIETARILEECRRSEEQIRTYRTEMEEIVSKYLKERLETFESGFSAMDQAILANDTNGYLKGNAEIQKLLGHEVQFETKEEFDDLMDSDAPLKL